jgi:hypothetical protein
MSENCKNCEYETLKDFLKPCNECFNSFCGMPFSPSKWEKKREEKVQEAKCKTGE